LAPRRPAARNLVRLADQRANEGKKTAEIGPAVRRLVRLADHRANEGHNTGQFGSADRPLLRLADQVRLRRSGLVGRL
jgi:hypothetical protein